jgi:hypothetical protein
MKPKLTIFLALVMAAMVFSGCQNQTVTEYPDRILQQYLEAWAWGDTLKMYGLLTQSEKNITSYGEYDQNFDELPIRPYQYQIIEVKISGKTARVKSELVMPSMTLSESTTKTQEYGQVSREIVTFVLKKEGQDWRVSEKETFDRDDRVQKNP